MTRLVNQFYGGPNVSRFLLSFVLLLVFVTCSSPREFGNEGRSRGDHKLLTRLVNQFYGGPNGFTETDASSCGLTP